MFAASLSSTHFSCTETAPRRKVQLCQRSALNLGAFRKSACTVGHQRGGLVIQMAATKEKKNADLARLTEFLNTDETLVVAAVNYKGLSVSFLIFQFICFIINFYYISR